MSILAPVDFGVLVQRAFFEFERRRTIFDLGETQFHRARAGFDLAVRRHGTRVANPAGIAAGPHTQLSANIVLGWLAGARVFELKTVQVPETAHAPRPAVDLGDPPLHAAAAHELRLEPALLEFVGAAMLIDMLSASGVLDGPGGDDTFAHAESTFDVSLGADLRSLRSPRLVAFVRGLQDARDSIATLRARIPDRLAPLRALEFRTAVLGGVTLVPPAGAGIDDIAAAAEFALHELDAAVTLKLRPTLLGLERCEALVHDVLGYTDLRIDPAPFATEPRLETLAPVLLDLRAQAQAANLHFGLQLLGPLSVRNPRTVLADDTVQMSGAPLHVLAMHALQAVRAVLGPEIPVAFSGGVDALVFARVVACGAVPAATCTDLLRPGGYARLPAYHRGLETEMERVGARTLGDFVLRAERTGEASARQAIAELLDGIRHACREAPPERRVGLGEEATRFAATLERRACETVRGSPYQDVRAALGAVWRTRAEPLRAVLRPGREAHDVETLYLRMIELAAARNVPAVAARASDDVRFAAGGAAAGAVALGKLGSHLSLWDCVSCDRCVPACPNAANFVYDVEPQDILCAAYAWRGGTLEPSESARFVVRRQHQLAHFADLCDDCGNCDWVCPEDGSPTLDKPRFFASLESWRGDGGTGFHVRLGARPGIWGRFAGGDEHFVQVDAARGEALFKTCGLDVEIDLTTHRPRGVRGVAGAAEGARVDMRAYHVLRTLLEAARDTRRVHWVNGAHA
jgi:putative selenate reductase